MSSEEQILNQTLEGATPATSIQAPGITPAKTLDDVVLMIEEILGQSPAYIKGESKSSKPKFSLVDYLKNQLLILQDHINRNNKDLPAEQLFLIKTYFESILKTYEILRCFDLKVAETELITYNIGYNTQSLKKYYDRYRKVQDPEG